MTSCTGSVRGGFGGFWEKSVELRTRDRTRRVDFRGWLRRDEFVRYGRCTRWGGGRWKSQNRKNLYLSPDVEEPLNSKVIKSFVPELRSRKCFCVSGFLCSMYICYEHYMYVSHTKCDSNQRFFRNNLNQQYWVFSCNVLPIEAGFHFRVKNSENLKQFNRKKCQFVGEGITNWIWKWVDVYIDFAWIQFSLCSFLSPDVETKQFQNRYSKIVEWAFG